MSTEDLHALRDIIHRQTASPGGILPARQESPSRQMTTVRALHRRLEKLEAVLDILSSSVSPFMSGCYG
jgi:hypothetical protein